MTATVDPLFSQDFAIVKTDRSRQNLAYLIEFNDQQVADQLLTVLPTLHGMLRQAWQDSHRRRLEALTAALVEARMPLSAAEQKQADMAAELRLRLLRDYGGLLSAEEVAEQAHSRARNRAALASKWKQEGQVLTVAHQGRERFPAFQFDPHSGRPRPTIAKLLQASAGRLSGWELIYWLLTPNSLLAASTRPIERLDTDPEAVAEALQRQLDRAAAF